MNHEIKFDHTKYTGMIRIEIDHENQRCIKENPDNTAITIATNELIFRFISD